jgi:hypothetical protein
LRQGDACLFPNVTWLAGELKDCVLQAPGPITAPPERVIVLIDCTLRAPDAGGTTFTVDVQTNTVTLTGQTCADALDPSVQRVDLYTTCVSCC